MQMGWGEAPAQVEIVLRDAADEPLGEDAPVTARGLDEITLEIHETWATTKVRTFEALNGYMRVGRLLCEARELFPSDTKFGQWRAEQDFGFSQPWAYQLMTLARNESQVREAATSALMSGQPVPGVDRLVRIVTGREEAFHIRRDEQARQRTMARAGARIAMMERELERARQEATAESADRQVMQFRWRKQVVNRLREVAAIEPVEFVPRLTPSARDETREAIATIRDWAVWTLEEMDKAENESSHEDQLDSPTDQLNAPSGTPSSITEGPADGSN